MVRRLVAETAKFGYHPAARREYEAAVVWYNSKDEKLATISSTT
jgi:hypothetical protein